MYKKHILSNGLRVIFTPLQNSQTVTVLTLVATGSKYEEKQNNGISHFLEHMFFKGTKRRPNTLAIAETLDRVGGSYNAFTGKEYTGYFAKVDFSHFDLALDWVSDIFLNSKIEADEIEKEKGVIIEEFNMYLDTPTQYIGSLWEELLYGDQPAGWDIIGTKDNLLKFKQSDFLDYLKNHYSAVNTIVAVAGNFNEETALVKIQEYFGIMNSQKNLDKLKTKENQQAPAIKIHFKKTDQTHLCLGVRACNLFDEKKYALEILATILGGNMSSRLFIEVREKRGLAYYIHTSLDTFTDTGYLVTQAGVPNKDLEGAVGVILQEYQKIRQGEFTGEDLQKAKDFLKGSLVLGLESSDAFASFYGGQELLQKEILTPEEKCFKIDKVSLQEVKEAARGVFKPEKLNLALIGPHKKVVDLQKLLNKF